MRGLTLTLGLSALMSVGVVLGSVALNDAWTDADDNTPMVDTQIPSVETPIGVSDADDSAGPPPVVDTQIPPVETPVVPPVAPRRQPRTVVLRVHAPGGRCWSATIAGRPLRDGCGSVEFPLEVEGFVLVHFELRPSGDGQLTAMIEADGRVVQTVGPTTGQYPSFDIAYRVPGSE